MPKINSSKNAVTLSLAAKIRKRIDEDDASESAPPLAVKNKKCSKNRFAQGKMIPSSNSDKAAVISRGVTKKRKRTSDAVDSSGSKPAGKVKRAKKKLKVSEHNCQTNDHDRKISLSKKSNKKSRANSKSAQSVHHIENDVRMSGGDDGDIASLLRLGEGAPVSSSVSCEHASAEMCASDESDEDDDWEAVEAGPCQREVDARGFVEVTVTPAASSGAAQKKSKKSLDVHAYVRRQLARVERQIHSAVHHAHLLCLLARYLQLNTALNEPQLLAVAMSMLPSRFAYPPERLATSYVRALLGWFCGKVAAGGAAASSSHSSPPPLDIEQCASVLQAALVVRRARSQLEHVCLFVLLVRAIGLDCRLVVSLQPTPMRPHALQSTVSLAKNPTGKTDKKCSVDGAQQAASNKSNGGGSSGVSSSVARKKTKSPESKVQRPKCKSGADAVRAPTRSSTRNVKHRDHNASQGGPAQHDDDFTDTNESDRRGKSSAKTQPPATKKNGAKTGDKCDLSAPTQEPDASSSSCSTKRDVWAEVYVDSESRWVSVDVLADKVDCAGDIRRTCTLPILYVIGLDNSGRVRDVTARYDTRWQSTWRRARVDERWWRVALAPWRGTCHAPRDRLEEQQLTAALQEQPLPRTIAEYKNHPMFALERHLLKFEAIYPPSSVPLGYIGGGGGGSKKSSCDRGAPTKREPVYARECVVTLRSRETWLKQARVVCDDETPYRVVKARPKWDRVLKRSITDKPLEVFGLWQTCDYEPPVARDGLVPRNAYGNVELYQPSMLPGGTVHLPVEGLSRLARKLDIDCAPAMVGWDFHGGGSHPVFRGHVVCAEFEETLMSAWHQEQADAQKREVEKRERRILDNWKRLVRGLMIRKKLAKKYNFGEPKTADHTVENKAAKAKNNCAAIAGNTDKSSGNAKKRQTAKKKPNRLMAAAIEETPVVGVVPDVTATADAPAPAAEQKQQHVAACLAAMRLDQVALSSSDSEPEAHADAAQRRQPSGGGSSSDDDLALSAVRRRLAVSGACRDARNGDTPANRGSADVARKGAIKRRRRRRRTSTEQASDGGASSGQSVNHRQSTRGRRSCARVNYTEPSVDDAVDEPWAQYDSSSADDFDGFAAVSSDASSNA